MTLTCILVVSGWANAQPFTGEGFILSKNADFSTDDRTFFDTDTIYMLVWTDEVDFNDIKKMEWELKADEKVKQDFTNNLDNSYTASFNLADLPEDATEWEWKCKIEDHDDNKYKPKDDIFVLPAPPPPPTPMPPVAGFAGAPTSGTHPLVVNFTDQSANLPTSWAWDFGDGNTSTEQNPTHTYTAAGAYTVVLTATNGLGSDTMTSASSVVVNDPSPYTGEGYILSRNADFSTDDRTFYRSDTIYMIVWSDVIDYTDIKKEEWELKSGSKKEKDDFTNNNDGTYTAAFALVNLPSDSTNWTWKAKIEEDGGPKYKPEDSITVLPGGSPPTSEFSATTTAGIAPLVVDFVDQSTDNPDAWSWEFGDGGTSSAQSPTHTYALPGVYTVTLTASNAFGFDTRTRTNYIIVTGPPQPPIAEFEGTPTSGTEPLVVNFTDQSTQSPTSWSWSFGDGGTSTAQNPSHTYGAAGTYTVTLTATNADGSDTRTRTNYITVAAQPQPPEADFVATPTSGIQPFVVLFTDLSSGNPTSWSWSFGDGGVSTEQHPSHVYVAPGTYTVTLTVTNADGSDTRTRTDYITVTAPPQPPVAEFVGTPTVGTQPLVVNFTDQSTQNPTSWSWSFGDGGTSSAQHPTHTYANPGTYTVTLTATNGDGSDTRTRTDYIVVSAPPQPPVAEFVGTPTSGTQPLVVNFTDQSTQNPTSWSWSFGDGGTSSAQHPTHTYASPGTYTVTLTATNADGSDTRTRTDYIVVSAQPQPPVAEFEGTPTSGTQPLVVNFTDQSTQNPTSWLWTFGDGGTSSAQHPTHTYASPGSYTVTLTATNADGSDTRTRTDYIVVSAQPQPPVAEFQGTPTAGNHPLLVNFTDQSTQNPTSWSWTFGDGGTSTAQHPSHTYVTPGTYTVTLTATNADGSDVRVRTDYITVNAPNPPPTAEFVGAPTTGIEPLVVGFTDQSTDNPTSWLWNFGDGNMSTEQNPTHTYVAPGTYTVMLTASNVHGMNTRTRTSYVTVSPLPDPPVVNITFPSEMNELASLPAVHFDVENWTVGAGTTHAIGSINGVVDQHLYSLDPWALPPLPPGLYNLRVELAEANGTPTGVFDDVTVTIIDTLPCVEILTPPDGLSVTSPVVCVFDVANWPLAPNGNYVRSEVNGEFYGTHTSVTPFSLDLPGGVHVVRLELIDAADNPTGVFDEVLLDVAGPMPSVTITSPGPGATVQAPFDVHFTASNWDLLLGAVRIYIDGNLIGSQHSPNPITVGSLAPGLHVIALELENEDGSLAGYSDTVQVSAPAAPSAIRINCGGPQVTVGGNVWSADSYFSGGNTASNFVPIDNTNLDPIYQTERWGNCIYQIPVQGAGNYDIVLHFADIYFGAPNGGPGGPGLRIFDVLVEGAQGLLNDYDIWADVGPTTAVTHTFSGVSVQDGFATVVFQTVVDNAKISAIEVIGGTTPPPPPQPSIVITSPADQVTVSSPLEVAFALTDSETHVELAVDGVVVATTTSLAPFSLPHLADGPHTLTVTLLDNVGQPTAYTDSVNIDIANPFAMRINCGGSQVTTGGRIWQADSYFTGGAPGSNSLSTIATTDDVLYHSDRHGTHSYEIPVPQDGNYDVVLHFSENDLGAFGLGLGGVGSRVFDVNIENATGILDDYDIFALAGSAKAIRESFVDVFVDDGFLSIDLTSIAGDAKICAIEVSAMQPAPILGLDSWVRHEIDGPLPYRALFVGAADVNGDGLSDIVCGGSWYQNPGLPGGTWTQHTIGAPLHNMTLLYDFDGDGDTDVLGTPGQPGSIALLWGRNDGAGNFAVIDNVPDGTSSAFQPFPSGMAGGFFDTSGNFQIACSWNAAENGSSQVQLVTVPLNPSTTSWSMTNLHPSSRGEDLQAGDIDDDGDLDLFQGDQWLRNDSGTWTSFSVGNLAAFGHVDRNRLADVDGDGDLDAVVGFISNPGPLVWLEAPNDPTQLWTLHTVAANLASGLSLDVADFDNDGDIDISHGEQGPNGRALIHENLGNGASWATHVVDDGLGGGVGGLDHHQGSIAFDIDGDGDLDILSLGWDNVRVWLFENQAIP